MAGRMEKSGEPRGKAGENGGKRASVADRAAPHRFSLVPERPGDTRPLGFGAGSPALYFA